MSETSQLTTDVEYAAHIVRNGGVIGMPTETVYGLAARADRENSVGRIFDIKGRPRNHPLIAHLGPNADPAQWGHMNTHAESLASQFWPGPLTILVPRTTRVPDWVTGGRDTVGLRVPSHRMTQELLSLVPEAVVAPSANKFGRVSPTTALHVLNDLGNEVDCVLDGGPCAIGLESTIVECVGKSVTILRPGAVTAAEISRLLDIELVLETGDSRAPGMLLSHYAPLATVHLVASVENARTVTKDLELEKFKVEILHYDDVYEYALHLYDRLRRADFDGVDHVVAVLPSGQGLSEAIRDRLKKAAATT